MINNGTLGFKGISKSRGFSLKTRMEREQMNNPDKNEIKMVIAAIPTAWWAERNGKMAIAEIRGGPLAPAIRGMVFFQDVPGGVWVSVDIIGLPLYKPGVEGKQPVGPHGFHIHEHGNCETGNPNNPFLAAGGHWNPANQPHGNHAGDFPVLFSHRGRSVMSFFTANFKVPDIIGYSIIIHENPDDYRTPPAGNAGKRLACGIIQLYGSP